MPEFTGRNDLRSYLRTLWRWKLLFLAFLIAAPVATYLLQRGKPLTYHAHAVVGVSSLTIPSSVAGGSPYTTPNLQAAAQLLETSAEFSKIAGRQMKPPESGSAVAGAISASGDQTTGLLTLSSTAATPGRAVAVANAFAKALLVTQAQATSQLNSKIQQKKNKLANMSRTNANYQALASDISQLESQAQTQSTGVSVVQAATSASATGPSTRRAIELGLVIGLLLGVAAVFVAEGADRRFRSADDLESATDFPLLAAIPPTAFSEELDTGPIDEEAFQMLRTSLTYFTADRALHSVLIASPGEKEGKSTVAARLALAAAHAGLDVVLVDADLRRAGASAKFGITAQAGLGSVLGGLQPVDSVLIDWPITGDEAGRLRIVPAGPPPANTSALISSDQMRLVLAQLEERSDLVIVDSPAALAVSDAVPLMRSVSGIVLVARMNHSNRDTIGRLQKMIGSAHGNVLGVVATGVTRGGYEKYSRDYYGPVDHKRRGRRRRRGKASAQHGPAGIPIAAPTESNNHHAQVTAADQDAPAPS